MGALFILILVFRKGRLSRFPERWEGLLPHFFPALPVDKALNTLTNSLRNTPIVCS